MPVMHRAEVSFRADEPWRQAPGDTEGVAHACAWQRESLVVDRGEPLPEALSGVEGESGGKDNRRAAKTKTPKRKGKQKRRR